MKKTKLLVAVMLIFCLGLLPGCSKNSNTVKTPDITQIRSICNLATLECYYHNVAKSGKTADSWFKKDREFWIEYTGVAKIGIDMSKVKMDVVGDNVTISLPNAQLLDVDILEKDLNQDSYITSADSWIRNKITADDQTKAINSAQEEMSNSVRRNSALLLNAQERAKTLIEKYIKNLGEVSNTDYQINWVYENPPAETIEETVTAEKTEERQSS